MNSNEAFQLFPALNPATEAALRASIERFGVLVPVVRDQHGNTLDGYHRSRIAQELGVRFRVDVVSVSDPTEAREIAHTLNADRRQLSPEQRREVDVPLYEEGHSPRAIAEALGVSERTVLRDLAGAAHAAPERTRGRDGKSYAARRPTVVAAKNEREAERAQEALLTAELPNVPVVDVKRVERLAREQAAARSWEDAPAIPHEGADVIIEHADFRDGLSRWDISDAIIITDPPYPREFLPEWRDMATLALEGGADALIAMCGQSILPDALDAVDDRWIYRWTCAYLTPGPATRVWGAQVGAAWKPVLVFDRGDERRFLTSDLIRSGGDDKEHHRWGQSESGMAALVEAFSNPGDLVVDPFLGGGTTAVVCKALGRRFLGCDIDASAVGATIKRLAE